MDLSMRVYGLACLLLLFTSVSSEEKTHPQLVKQLKKQIFANYSRNFIPTKNTSEPIDFNIFLQVYHIEEVREADQSLKLHAWVSTSWKDEYLKWDHSKGSDYENMTMIWIDPWLVWKPDIGIHNSIQGRKQAMSFWRTGMRSLVTSNGYVSVFFDSAIHVSCPMSLKHYPRDVQTCPVAIGSWMYNIMQLQIKWSYGHHRIHWESEGEMMGSNTKHASGWWIEGVKSKKRYWTYQGVTDKKPEDLPENFVWSVSEFMVTLRRFSPYFGVIIVLPCIVTMSLTLIGFWIPEWDIAASCYIVNVILQALFLRDLMLTVPVSLDGQPKIVSFYALHLCCTLISFTLLFMLRNLAQTKMKQQVPSWVQTAVIQTRMVKVGTVVETVRRLSVRSKGNTTDDLETIVQNEQEPVKTQSILAKQMPVGWPLVLAMVRKIAFGVFCFIYMIALLVAAFP